jgi:hypothetical protein
MTSDIRLKNGKNADHAARFFGCHYCANLLKVLKRWPIIDHSGLKKPERAHPPQLAAE